MAVMNTTDKVGGKLFSVTLPSGMGIANDARIARASHNKMLMH